MEHRTVGAPSVRAALRAFRLADDQQDAAHPEAVAVSLYLGLRAATTPFACNVSISVALIPSTSFSTSCVCSPSRGAGVRICAGVFDSRTGLPTARIRPTVG